MKLLTNTKIKTIKDKNDENLPHLELTKLVLPHYQHDYKIFYIFGQ